MLGIILSANFSTNIESCKLYSQYFSISSFPKSQATPIKSGLKSIFFSFKSSNETLFNV